MWKRILHRETFEALGEKPEIPKKKKRKNPLR